MKDTIHLLHEGWYCNRLSYSQGHPDYKGCVDCGKLWDKCIDSAMTFHTKNSKGLSGKIGELIIDSDYVPEKINLPIDTLVVDLTNSDDYNNENWVGEGVTSMHEQVFCTKVTINKTVIK
eukprot:3224308-Ditylum_brightwellii.AAC.1